MFGVGSVMVLHFVQHERVGVQRQQQRHECRCSARRRRSVLGRSSALKTTFPRPSPPLHPLQIFNPRIPTRYAHTEVAAATADTLLGGRLETTLVLEVVDTLADGLAVGGTLGGRLFAVTAADTDAVHDVALLGLVSEAAGLVGARGARRAVDDRELAVLPAADARDELENVRLLLGVELGEVLVGAHLEIVLGWPFFREEWEDGQVRVRRALCRVVEGGLLVGRCSP